MDHLKIWRKFRVAVYGSPAFASSSTVKTQSSYIKRRVPMGEQLNAAREQWECSRIPIAEEEEEQPTEKRKRNKTSLCV